MPYLGKIPTCWAIGNKLELTEIEPNATRTFSRCCSRALCASTVVTLIAKKRMKRFTSQLPPTVDACLLFIAFFLLPRAYFILLRTVLLNAQRQSDLLMLLYRPKLCHRLYLLASAA